MYIRFFVFLLGIFFFSAYALAEEGKAKNVHLDHPDHVPHETGKNPTKDSHDACVFPKKRKKDRKLK